MSAGSVSKHRSSRSEIGGWRLDIQGLLQQKRRFCLGKISEIPAVTPPKFNIEPENNGFQRVPCQISGV